MRTRDERVRPEWVIRRVIRRRRTLGALAERPCHQNRCDRNPTKQLERQTALAGSRRSGRLRGTGTEIVRKQTEAKILQNEPPICIRDYP
jgi:hypothetical protein